MLVWKRHPISALSTAARKQVGPVRSPVWLCVLVVLAATPAFSADMGTCRKHLLHGRYNECIREAADAINNRRYGEDWRVLKAEAEIATGRHAAAIRTIETALERYSWSVRLRLLAHDMYQSTNRPDDAAAELKKIDVLVTNAPWRYSDVDDLVTLGKAATLIGADARSVLEGFYDQAKKYGTSRREPYLASGELALAKNDNELAAEYFQHVLKLDENDPDALFGMSRALESVDRKTSLAALTKVLEGNPNHSAAILEHAERLVDIEDYNDAQKWIDRALAINDKLPRAWALKAVIAHLQHDPRGEATFRAAALGGWQQNPFVDHFIGFKLSRKYRFREGATYQQQALRFNANYLPAKIQRAQDLLRLGIEAEGWKLATAAHEQDGYDSVTFNLLELHDELTKFQTIETDEFIIRMSPKEAAVYGNHVVTLLTRAKQKLCKKYGCNLDGPVTVEIFPDENDFAVRTFGMPAVSGFLGVCFGRVITANSPASRMDHPSNWEAVLWHEFCHVITLELTRNKMPRWLSEGISVYEERQENPSWGQVMNPTYREMVLGGELTPVSKLSGAFMSPKSQMHVQFAYYQSSLVVEFIIQEFGFQPLRNILNDLGRGVAINDAIERHTVPLSVLEPAFEKHAKAIANNLAPDVDWTKPDLPSLLNGEGESLDDFVAKNPNNLFALTAKAELHLEAEEWAAAAKPLKQLLKIYPGYTGGQNAYESLARVYQHLGNTEEERKLLESFAQLEADAVAANSRLIEIDKASQNWPGIAAAADRLTAINPFFPQAYRSAAESAERQNEPHKAIAAYNSLLGLGTENTAVINYNLARLKYQLGEGDAKRHVLLALEEAPRFRDALRLLTQIRRTQSRPKQNAN